MKGTLGENKKVWLLNSWFKGWNKLKTAFAIKSPWTENALIWFHKNYYLSSSYSGWFGIEVNLKNYKTGDEHFYYEVIYELNKKTTNKISGKEISNYFEELNSSNSEEYRNLVKELSGIKIYD